MVKKNTKLLLYSSFYLDVFFMEMYNCMGFW